MSTSKHDWEPPFPLGDFSTPPFPSEVFPRRVQDFVQELSCSTETPIELASLAALSGIATAAQGRYVVQVKSDYHEPLNIWTSIALPSGSRKSKVQEYVTAPLRDFERRKKEELEPLVLERTSKNKTLDARIKEVRQRAAKADEGDFFDVQNELDEIERLIDPIPIVPQLWTSDVTPENLGVIMAENDECMSILSDEPGIFDILGGRYSSGIPNLDLFLQGHSGSSTRVNRGSRPPLFLNSPCITIGLTPQPSMLQGLTKNAAFRGRGLLARFFYAIPPSNLGFRSLDAPSITQEAQKGYYDTIMGLLSTPRNGEPRRIMLSKEAYSEWHNYARVIEIKMGDGGTFSHIRDWGGKLPGGIIRIVGLIHVSRYFDQDPSAIEISLEDMKAAIKIGHVLSEHALAVFDLMGADLAQEGARHVLAWTKRTQRREFTFRDCQYENKSRFKNKKDLQAAIEVLEDAGYIRERNNEVKVGRPSRHFDSNPFIFEMG